jgi:hypothetical protein
VCVPVVMEPSSPVRRAVGECTVTSLVSDLRVLHKDKEPGANPIIVLTNVKER